MMTTVEQTPRGEIVTSVPGYSEKKFLHTLVAGAWLPLVISLITGAILLLLSAVTIWVIDRGWSIRWAVLIGAIGAAGTWLIMLRRWMDITRLEEITGLDLNRDGVIGEEVVIKKIKLQASRYDEKGKYQGSSFYDLPINEDQLIKLARGVVAGVPFSEREWTGEGNPLSSGEFRRLRHAAIARGLLVMVSEKDPRQGFKWVAEAMHMFDEIVKDSPPPLENAG